MKKSWRNNIGRDLIFGRILLAGMLSLVLWACGNSDTAHEHGIYTCPMHPSVVADRPGSCPICGMDLVRRASDGEEVKIDNDLAQLLQSPNEVVIATMPTIKGDYTSKSVYIDAPGVVTYDTRGIHTIAARVSGRLERVYLKYTFQRVTKGQKIAEIYSPELVTAQRELLFLLAHDPGNTSLIATAKDKLRLLGLTDSQIATLMKDQQAESTLAVYSPFSGYLISGQEAIPPAAGPSPGRVGAGGSMADGMGGAKSNSPAAPSAVRTVPPAPLVREGDYISAGQTLFTVVDPDALRIEINIPGAYADNVEKGNQIEWQRRGKTEKASIDLVQPFFSEGQNFLKLRAYAHESNDLQPGQLIDARIAISSPETLWIPEEAILDLGTRKIVFVRDGKVLRPRTITTGLEAGGTIAVNSGLSSSDEIAADAQYLVDSESFIKPAQ